MGTSRRTSRPLAEQILLRLDRLEMALVSSLYQVRSDASTAFHWNSTVSPVYPAPFSADSDDYVDELFADSPAPGIWDKPNETVDNVANLVADQMDEASLSSARNESWHEDSNGNASEISKDVESMRAFCLSPPSYPEAVSGPAAADLVDVGILLEEICASRDELKAVLAQGEELKRTMSVTADVASKLLVVAESSESDAAISAARAAVQRERKAKDAYAEWVQRVQRLAAPKGTCRASPKKTKKRSPQEGLQKKFGKYVLS